MSQTTKLDPIASTAHAMADAAGEVTLAFFRRGDLAVSNKAVGAERFDPVTEADRGAEHAIRSVIAEHFPDDRILGEEFEAVTGDGAREWVIDPIDGTGAFICGLPTWGTLIGLRDSERVHFGLMDQPFTRERYWGGAEDGSFFAVSNAAPARLATAPTRNVSAASLATTD
ncbi:MAG: inositol monophosphatase family protein, partial [Pseudomonadota bacterium]